MADHDALIEQLRLEAESCYPQMAGLLTEAADALAALSAPPTDPEARRKADTTAALFAELYPDLDWNAFSAEAQATWIDGLDAQGAFDPPAAPGDDRG